MQLAAQGQLGGAGAPVEDADMPVMRPSTIMEGGDGDLLLKHRQKHLGVATTTVFFSYSKL